MDEQNTMTFMMLVSGRQKAKKRHSHTQPNLGNRLEEWTNIRNTKSQYTKKLRNFLKVSAITRHSKTTPTNIIQKDQRYQRTLQTNGSRS